MSKLLYFLILISNLSIAQIYYSHYIDETSVWKTEDHEVLFSSFSSLNVIFYATEYIDGKMDYNGYTYYKKYRIYKRFGVVTKEGPTYIREDINGNFYYLYTENNITGEKLLLDNNSIKNIQDGVICSNNNLPINVSFVTVDGLNLKKAKSRGYGIEGIGMYAGNLICYGVTYYCTRCQSGQYYAIDHKYLYSYTKNGSTYRENTTLGNDSDYLEPTYLNTSSVNKVDTKIFPNPTYDKVNIQSDSKMKLIEIFDIQGRKLETINLNKSETQLDMSKYQKGNYIIKINTDLGIITKQILKN